MSDPSGTDELARTARRLETACSIIQVVHRSLSLQDVIEAIVENLVDPAGIRGAEIVLDARVETLDLRQRASAGGTSNDEALTRRTPIHIRGLEVGVLTTYYQSEDVEGQDELLEFLLPTLFMGIEHATSFAEVMDYRKTLEDKVVERTAQLAEAHSQLGRSLDELREAKAARDRFFANINHEIRTPVTLILLSADGVARSGELSSNALQKLEEVKSSSRRLLHLVNSLLVLAAGDEGKLRIRPGPVDVASVLERVARSWQSAAQKGQLAIEYRGPSHCPASMDEAAIETIVGNFVSNAVKFTPHGGTVTVTLEPTDETVTIRVRDTGPGIDPEFIPKLFGRFERSSSAVASGVRGTGIGLSLSKELVDLQRGSIEVIRHDDPTGTSFVVTLPRQQAVTTVLPHEEVRPAIETAEPIRGDAPPEPRRVKVAEPEATILLAEDDPGLSAHMSEILSERYRVLVAPNGKAALELAREHLPDLLVTDLDMPEMNGIELTRHFLALQGATLSPVLIVSAHAGLGERLAGFEAGAVDYVLKPFSADELLARIRSQLAIRKLALRLHESQKLAAMGMLSAGLAHELRNPANAIVNALPPLLELMPADMRQPDSACGMLLDITLEAAKQIRERSKNILDYSRAERVSKRPEDMRALLARVLRTLTIQLVGCEVRQDIQLDETVDCAAPLIEQILVNLIDNAAYAAGTGGWVQISARREGALAVIEVGDSGPGVPVAIRDRIFDPFFTTKPVGEGSGLGLTISRRIALNHGGELRVVARGEGTVFRLELP
jgi:signal transduction histidine kinase